MARAGSASAFRTLPTFLEPLHRALMVQCVPRAVESVVTPVRRDGGGLVLTVEGGDTEAALDTARRLVHGRAFRQPVLLDAARYSGPDRRDGREPFTVDWLRRQRELGLPVLTDSGYVGERDDQALESILGRAQLAGDVIALLPLHLSWLRDPLPRMVLSAHLRDTGIPVALVVEHGGDPYSVPGVVDGLREVLSVGVPVLVLRSDVSGVGALAAGALAAAVGAAAGLRHLAPEAEGRGASALPAAFVKQCMAYVQLPRHAGWICSCHTCQGRALTWLAGQPHRTQVEHSFETLLDLRDELFRPGTTRLQRLGTWRDWCATALYRQAEADHPEAQALRQWSHVLT